VLPGSLGAVWLHSLFNQRNLADGANRVFLFVSAETAVIASTLGALSTTQIVKGLWTQK
jgi:hypothetical protein